MIEGSEKARLQLIRRIVEEQGLRGQLKSGNLLTGQLFVAFNYFPDAPKPKIDWTKDPLELPVVPSTIPDLEAKLTGILEQARQPAARSDRRRGQARTSPRSTRRWRTRASS